MGSRRLQTRGRWRRKTNRYNPNAPDWNKVHVSGWLKVTALPAPANRGTADAIGKVILAWV